MSDEIQITVDGVPLKARKGQMLIEVTDAAGIDVPRFCYHKKLSVAANCRMCLVEVEKAPKPLPACATPCMPDMVVKTKSKLARAAQQGTMEFLLINHPLDCPICDQGGECELQDVAMGYGGSASQYTEGKRVVMDKYIGPLIATEMTRCIHCTRCVRFGEEIAGIRELGATGRGENVRIGTYIEKSVVSELSGNVIDICPVGALTARPSRFTARAWELKQHASIAPHDSVGSNIYVHMDGNKVNRVVPRENESVNEVWISDRDRFSYQGIKSSDRVTKPLIRENGELVETDWINALDKAAELLKDKGDKLGVLASASSTLEELYLIQKLARAMGTANIDHRLGQSDFSASDAAPVMPWLGMSLDQLESLDAALLVGSNIRKDQPIAALRLRKSALKGGAISFLNPKRFAMHFDGADMITTRFDAMVSEFACIAGAAGADLSGMNNVPSLQINEQHQRIADSLKAAGENTDKRAAVLLGNIAVSHPAYAQLLLIAHQLCKATGATLALLPERANTAGAWLAGVVPHRTVAGAIAPKTGLHAQAMLELQLENYLLLGCELEFDAANPGKAVAALAAAKTVVSISSYLSDSIREHADVVLPAAVFTETYGTYVNATGNWQTTKGISLPPGDARPSWKVLRVLAQSLELSGFDYDSPEAITREVQGQCTNVQLSNTISFSDALEFSAAVSSDTLMRAGEVPIYAVDAVVRHSNALQKAADGQQAFASMSTSEMERLGLNDGDIINVKQGAASAELPVRLDDDVPPACVWVPAGLPQTQSLGDLFAPVEVSKA